MKIKITPETKEEKKQFESKGIEEILYKNVNEYFFFGNRTDSDDNVIDIHEWHGGYRYLLGSLQYFYEVVNDMRKESSNSSGHVQRANVDLKLVQPPPMVKRGEVKDGNIQILDKGLELLDNDNITQIKPDLPDFNIDPKDIEMPNPENIRKAMHDLLPKMNVVDDNFETDGEVEEKNDENNETK